MTVTSLPTVPTDRQRAAFRAYALDRMQVGPADITASYGRQALTLGATVAQVRAGAEAYLATLGLAHRVDAFLARILASTTCEDNDAHDAHEFTVGADAYQCGGRA